jgi:hypothetical protein
MLGPATVGGSAAIPSSASGLEEALETLGVAARANTREPAMVVVKNTATHMSPRKGEGNVAVIPAPAEPSIASLVPRDTRDALGNSGP